MAVIRLALSVRSLSKPLLNTVQPRKVQLLGVMAIRSLSTLEITKNISLVSKHKIDTQVKDLRLTTAQDKPLVIMLSWLMAKPKQVNKYAQLYLDRGCDVLTVSITPWQLLWPVKGAQFVASDLLKFMDVNFPYSPLLLHGFSVGGYVWGEVLVKMAANLPKYQPIVDRIIGQVWDSAADITEISVGFPKAVFPKNRWMEATFRQYIEYHMKTFDKIATCHYLRSSQMYHTTLVKCPALVFLSKSDPIGSEISNQRVRESWESMGMKVYWKCWDRSPHVGHFVKHRDEYVSELNAFLDQITSTNQVMLKVKAKL